MINMQGFSGWSVERWLREEGSRNKVQVLTFGCVVLLIILLGVKLFSIESNNAALELIFS